MDATHAAQCGFGHTQAPRRAPESVWTREAGTRQFDEILTPDQNLHPRVLNLQPGNPRSLVALILLYCFMGNKVHSRDALMA